MNWFFYVGMGMLFVMIGQTIFNGFLDYKKMPSKDQSLFQSVTLLCLVFIWIWVCWKLKGVL